MRRNCGWVNGVSGVWVVALLGLAFPWSAGAATIVVTTTADDAATNGNCTLREAISAANGNLPVDGCPAGDDADETVDLTGVSGIIELGNPLPAVTVGVWIRGPGADLLAIDANGTGRVLHTVSPGDDPKVVVSGLTLTGGSVEGAGGGISNTGVLEVRRCIVTENSATLTGGGIYNEFGVLSVVETSISGNVSGSNAGGLYSAGVMSIERSSISDNDAAGSGGGVYTEGVLTVFESTISGNTTEGSGGGLLVWSGPASLSHVTIARNLNEGIFGGDGIMVFDTGTVELRDTIIALHDQNCRILNPGQGFIHSLGHNLEDGNRCGLDHPEDLPNTNPLMGPLADNGGPTPTHALLPGSPAIDGAWAVQTPGADQRGVARTQGTGPDIGAFEYAVMPIPTGVNVNSYGETADPVLSTDATTARAVVSGNISSGTLRVRVGLLPSAAPTDLYLGLTLPGSAPDILLVTPDLSFPSAADGLVPWTTVGTTYGVSEDLFGRVPVTTLPVGSYTLYLLRQESGGDFSAFDLWVHSFTIP